MARTVQKETALSERVDKLLVARGLADSRTKAQAMVMAGVVLANERKIEKPSELVSLAAIIRIKGQSEETKYASRAGLKLEHALSHYGINPAGFVCLDIGSSTGGFTDCLLKYGAARVVAIDSGTNQMIWRLRNDPRVDLRENTNARHLKPDDFAEKFPLAVIDVSFISVTKILPAVVLLMAYPGRIIALIKPQFEVGKGEVGKGGIVREADKHQAVVKNVNSVAGDLGLKFGGVTESPILGSKGNIEFLALYEN